MAQLSNLTIQEISTIIRDDWKELSKANIYAKHYVMAMEVMEAKEPSFYDDGRFIISRFIAHSRSWKGTISREVRKELKKRLK